MDTAKRDTLRMTEMDNWKEEEEKLKSLRTHAYFRPIHAGVGCCSG